MGRNRVSNDVDHVDDQRTTTKQAKSAPPKPGRLPKFNPLNIKNGTQYGGAKLPMETTLQAYVIFTLFFTERILNTLVDNTNKYAADHSRHNAEDVPFARNWYPTTLDELNAYIATYIYMGIHQKPRVEDYWNRDGNRDPLHPLVYDHIGLCRWQQIDRFFHISEHPEAEDVFGKIDHLSEHLRQAFKRYWEPGTHLTVDESIQRFMGRANETVNIPSKPEPEGFKIWVLANAGYVLDWMFHAKGNKKGPVDLDETWTKKRGFSKTQAVVLDLLQQDGIADDYQHVVWLNNLFTSARLLAVLRDMGFGAASTVRTSKTKRELLEGELGEEAQQKMSKKEPNRGLEPSLSELKLKYEAQIEWGALYGALSKDDKVLELA